MKKYQKNNKKLQKKLNFYATSVNFSFDLLK